MPRPLAAGQALPLHDTQATRLLEEQAAAALPPHALMQRAGLATARLALALAPHARRVWIACGPGNNGGDGFEASVHLQAWGLNPVLSWRGDAACLPADAGASLQRARQAGVSFSEDRPPVLGPQDLAIDALLGIGARSAPRDHLAQWWQALQTGPAPLLAIDLPSGLDADTGVWHRPDPDAKLPPAARHTLSLLTLKPGLFTAQGRDACGRLWFHDLGVEPQLSGARAWLNHPQPAPIRPHASHKGSFGDVAVIGGQSDPAAGTAMAGAALLAASAALHGGAGRVYVSLLGSGAATLDPSRPELMFRPPAALPLAELTAVCGCGGGQAVAALLPGLLRQSPRLVLDADALNALAADPALQQALRARRAAGQDTVLTPHPLEAARLLSCSSGQVQADRLGAARQLVEQLGCTVVLKGSGSIIAAPGHRPRINPTGNARLAAAGTGDVLAGLIGARLAAGLPPLHAACDAVYRHGLAAEAWPEGQRLTAAALARTLT